MRVEAVSEQGCVRGRNEDAYLVDREMGLFVVADGVGGAPAGDVASRLAVDAIHECLSGGCDGFGDVGLALTTAHHRLRRQGASDPLLAGMATTAVVAWLDFMEQTLTVGHVGDSRAYLRTSTGLRRLTDDHGSGRRLTQVLGGETTPQPEIIEVPLRDASMLVMVTDGVTDVIDDETLARHTTGDDLARVRARILDAATTHGTRDNATVVVVDLAGVSRPVARQRR